MTEMLERIARAISNARNDGMPWDEIPPRYKPVYFNAARAAVEAMREPTTEMWRAYIIAHGYDPDEMADAVDKQLIGVGAKRDWYTMIDAILRDEP